MQLLSKAEYMNAVGPRNRRYYHTSILMSVNEATCPDSHEAATSEHHRGTHAVAINSFVTSAQSTIVGDQSRYP